jgi:hypothetical protein
MQTRDRKPYASATFAVTPVSHHPPHPTASYYHALIPLSQKEKRSIAITRSGGESETPDFTSSTEAFPKNEEGVPLKPVRRCSSGTRLRKGPHTQDLRLPGALFRTFSTRWRCAETYFPVEACTHSVSAELHEGEMPVERRFS